jgi:aldose 1-epimerase
MSDFVLEHGDVRIVARPSLGGALTNFCWRGRQIFRNAPAYSRDPVETAMFPIAPFVNRIACGRFYWGARDVTLTANYRDEPHALHGQAWQNPWRVDHYEASHIRMSFDYESGEWPWAYSCTQDIVLKENGALFSLSLINRSKAPMPASFGFHPYFAGKDRAVLQTQVSEMWSTDESLIPTSRNSPILALNKGASLHDAPFVDNTFTGWCGRATITRDDMGIDISASPIFGFLHLYAPHDNSFCAEPVSAMPNALNRPDVEANGVRVLAEGESLKGEMEIRVHLV